MMTVRGLFARVPEEPLSAHIRKQKLFVFIYPVLFGGIAFYCASTGRTHLFSRVSGQPSAQVTYLCRNLYLLFILT
jgi:hypothetical protein